jgi:phosphatidate cytidylyltransferase
MSPILSPGKTVEGAVGGLVTGAVASWAYFQFVVPQITGSDLPAAPWWGSWVYGLVIAIAGMTGDLVESLIKRDVSRKDSSSWLPGLGGVLDVLDSLLLAAPAALLCWLGGIVGPY